MDIINKYNSFIMKHFDGLHANFKILENLISNNIKMEYDYLDQLTMNWNLAFTQETGIKKDLIDFNGLLNLKEQRWIKAFIEGLFNVKFSKNALELFIDEFFDTLWFDDLFSFIDSDRIIIVKLDNKNFIHEKILNYYIDVQEGIKYSTNTFRRLL